MGNPWRGEVSLVIDGETHLLRLTLGALAALEARLETGSLVALVERYESGAFRASDVLLLLHAGLAGAGSDMTEETLARADIEGGPVAAARAGAALLARAFVVPGQET